jgi:glycerol-3-phosphate acyltransferase PlsX
LRIILDGMGGDNAPSSIVQGAIEALPFIDHDIFILGDDTAIHEELSKYEFDSTRIRVIASTQVITNDDSPVKAVRSKLDSSMVRGINMVKDGEGDLFVSAGSTGAMMAAGLFILHRITGIDRPAIATIYPILGRGFSLLVDAGANSECRASNYLEFAAMGSIYMEKVMGVDNPRIGLVNIGIEEKKGTATIKEAYGLLSKSKLNFIGNVEAREVPNGVCDVIVTDGFVGNVILKLTEGLASSILSTVKQKMLSSTMAKMGALMMKKELKELKDEFDYSEYGGAPLLGIRGPLVKMHGSSNAKSVRNTIIKAVPFMEGDIINTIESAIVDLKEISVAE